MPKEIFHLPYNRNLVERARELRKNPTPAEKKLWDECLRSFRHPVLRQRPILNYIVDFYIPALRWVIEIDGEQHFTDEGKVYDAERTGQLEASGLQMIRYSNVEVMEHLEEVCGEISRLRRGLRSRAIPPGYK